MVRKLSKKLLASVLSICTLMSVFVLGIPTAYAQEYSNTPSAISYVSELKAVNSDSASNAKSFLNGYTIIDHNFDVTGKRGIYIGYKTSTDIEQAITGIVFSDSSSPSKITYGGREYLRLEEQGRYVVLDSSGKSKSLCLYYTKAKDPHNTTEYLTALDAVGTKNSAMQGKDYKTVVNASTNMPQNVGEAKGGNKLPYIYLAYQSVPDLGSEYQKLGNDELEQSVKAINGINYYNFDADVSKNDFLIRALSEKEAGSNVSTVESWAQLLYSMMSMKGEGSGYQNRIDSSFKTIFGDGQYTDLVSALTSGAGTENSKYDRGLFIQSTGLKQTSSISKVRDAMLQLHTGLVDWDANNHDCNDVNELGEYLVKQDFFNNVTSSSDVVYSLCRVADDKAKTGHDKSVSVIGLVFYNFKLVPIIEDGSNQGNDTLNYSDVYRNVNEEKSSVKIDKNDTASTVSSSKSFANSMASSTTNSHSDTFGQTYTISEELSFSAGFANKESPLSVNMGIKLSASQAFNFSSTDTVTEAITQTETNTDGLSYSVPPYSIAALNCTSSKESREQKYDCPVALTYDVAFVGSGCELGATNLFETTFAYKSNYYAQFGGNGVSAVDTLNNIYKTNGEKTDNFKVSCTGQNEFNKYSTQEWSSILNKDINSREFPSTGAKTSNFITSCQPMSFLGGNFNSDVSAVSYTFDKFYALYPIDKIKVFKTDVASTSQTLVQHLDIVSRESIRLQDYYNTISAYDVHNSPWTNWDATQGYWALVSDDPNTGQEVITKITEEPVTDGIVKAYKDSKTGLIYITPVKKGKSYIRYVINENVFQYYPNVPGDATEFSTLNLKYTTNDDINAKGTIEVNTEKVANLEPDAFSSDKDGNLIIKSYDDLVRLSQLVREDYELYGSQSYILTKNIVAPQNSEWTQGIGSAAEKKPFNGTFDGNGYIISGLNIASSEYGGLFEEIGQQGTVKDLILIDCDYNKAAETAGSVAAVNNGTIDHCISGMNLTSGSIFVDINGDGVAEKINSTQFNSDIKGGLSGGIAALNTGNIIGCRNAGIVTGTQAGGGIAGENTGLIYGCANTGSIGDSHSNVSGGLVGKNAGEIKSSYNAGKVNAASENCKGSVAGLNGYGSVSDVAVENVFYTTANGLIPIGRSSKSQLNSTNLSKSKTDMHSDEFVDLLNSVSKEHNINWVENESRNNGYPTIECSFYILKTVKTNSGISVTAQMHPELAVEYKPCESEEINRFTEYANGEKIVSAYSPLLTDSSGNEIVTELWMQGSSTISVPVSDGNKRLVVIDSEGNVSDCDYIYKDGCAVFTVNEPVSFAFTEAESDSPRDNSNQNNQSKTAEKNINAVTNSGNAAAISENTTASNGSAVQTGNALPAAAMLIAVCALAACFLIKGKRSNE